MPINLTINNISDNDLSVMKIDSNQSSLSVPYKFRVKIKSAKPLFIDLTRHAIATLNIDKQYFRGIITQYTEILDCPNCYEILLSSPLSLLKYSQINRTFINKSLPDMIKNVLEIIPSYFTVSIDFINTYPQKTFIAQYNETDYVFLMRLLHENSIRFYFQHNKNHSQLILFDHLSAIPLTRTVVHHSSLSHLKEQEKYAFDLQSIYSSIRTKYIMQTNDISLVLGQLLDLKDHLIEEYNRTYRITAIMHHFNQSIYSNKIEMVPSDSESPVKKYQRKSSNLILQAEIYKSPDDYPILDEQGRYYVKFYFDQYSNKSHVIKRVQLYGGKTHSHPYGIHCPVRAGAEVAVGFEAGDLNKPFILGVLSHPLSPNVTTCDNPTQHRIRSWGGNELKLDDCYAKNKIILQTQKENQSLRLVNSKNSSHVQLACKNGDVQISSNQNMSAKSKTQHFQVGRGHYVTSGEQVVTSNKGDIQIQSAKNLLLKGNDDVCFTSDKADINISSKQNVDLKSWQAINIVAQDHAVMLQSKNGSIQIEANSANFSAKGKVELGSGISMCSGHLSFSQAILTAPIININPPVPEGGPVITKSRLSTLLQKNRKNKNKPFKLFPLIALNLRADRDDRYFANKRITNDPYRKAKLSATELAYFANHGNNATIFIHGYNVEYGSFGGKIDTKEKEALQQSVFKYQDIFRDRDILEDQFPDAKVNGKVLSSGGQLVLNEQINTINALHDLIEQPANNVDALLNGVDSHNWWLHMEWNFNKATQQFDGSDYDRYARMLHIAWQGNPKAPLDYMAALDTAKYTAHKLVPVIRQLNAAGIEVNIIAHSLGNQVLLETMNAIGKISREMINCVFMWDAAVADNSLAEKIVSTDKNRLYFFPYAERSAKQIIALCSEHDNILGPINPENPALWEKAKEAGFAMALMIKALDMIDHRMGSRKIKSVYNISNTFEHPFSDFLQDPQFRHVYYRHWILSHLNTEGRPFEHSLNNQLIVIRTIYPRAFNLVSIAIATIKYGVKYALKHWGNYKLHQNIHHPVSDRDCNEVAAIVITVFISEGGEPQSAMGYLGPDIDTIKKLDKKLKVIHQTPWLYSHSGMKIPSDDLMHEIYRKKIWQEVTSYHFGNYDK